MLSDDQMMLVAFGTVNPAIADLPHCICPLSQDEIPTVLDVVHAKGGIWGELPLFNADGTRYVPPWEEVAADFSLWEVPSNQSKLRRGLSGQPGSDSKYSLYGGLIHDSR
jgi:hypothetical protein